MNVKVSEELKIWKDFVNKILKRKIKTYHFENYILN